MSIASSSSWILKASDLFATEVVGDNLIMLDKRADAAGAHPTGEGGVEGVGGGEMPMGDPSESLPF